MTPHTKLQKIIHGIIKTIALAMKVDDEIRSSDGDTDWEKEICKTAMSTFLHCAFLNEDGKWQYGDGDIKIGWKRECFHDKRHPQPFKM